MSYTTTNPKACYQPFRSLPLIRPISCLGPAFRHDPAAVARQIATRTLDLARKALADHEEAYAAAKAAVGACNRMRTKSRHDSGIYSDRAVARRLSAAFGTMNRCRGHVSRARKAVAAAEAALLALAS